jgi:hypothetical protein
MPATTEGRATQRRDSNQFAPPVKAATKIPVGVMAAIDIAGMLVNASAVAAQLVVGVSEIDIDNSAGADGAIRGPVRRGCFKFANSAAADQITLTSYGQSCYVVDNQTVAKTSNAGARPVAGTVRDVEADGVWVQF